MKPTSIIFMILAAVLVVSGVILCFVGAGMASNENPLLCDSIDADGNEITTYSLTEFDLTDIEIDIKNAEVNIIGQSASSYIEFKNINAVTCDFAINKHKLTLTSVNPFNLSSMVKFRENEGGFGGLRHYLYLNRYKDKVSQINIYITPEQSMGSIKIRTQKGDVSVKNMISDTSYDLSAVDGNVIYENSITAEELNVNVKKGNFTFNSSSVSPLNFKIENGHGKFTLNRQYNLSCKCESGKIYLSDENVGESYQGVYPESAVESDTGIEPPNMASGEITSGDLYIDVAE